MTLPLLDWHVYLSNIHCFICIWRH